MSPHGNMYEHVPARDEPEGVAGLGVDDLAEPHRPGQQHHGGQGHAERQLVADHLRRAAQPAEQRILGIAGPAGQHDAVDPRSRRWRRRDSTPTLRSATCRGDRVVEPAEQRRRRPERHRREGDEAGRHRDDRRQREQQPIGGLRLQLLLEEQLDDVGDRLQQAPWDRPATGRSAAASAPPPCARRRPSPPPRSAARGTARRPARRTPPTSSAADETAQEVSSMTSGASVPSDARRRAARRGSRRRPGASRGRRPRTRA